MLSWCSSRSRSALLALALCLYCLHLALLSALGCCTRLQGGARSGWAPGTPGGGSPSPRGLLGVSTGSALGRRPGSVLWTSAGTEGGWTEAGAPGPLLRLLRKVSRCSGHHGSAPEAASQVALEDGGWRPRSSSWTELVSRPTPAASCPNTHLEASDLWVNYM